MPSFTTTATNTTNGAWTYRFTISVPLPPDDGLAGCYAVLGVPPNSPPDVVRKAYREKLKESHPDVGGDAAQVRRVIEAYERVTS